MHFSWQSYAKKWALGTYNHSLSIFNGKHLESSFCWNANPRRQFLCWLNIRRKYVFHECFVVTTNLFQRRTPFRGFLSGRIEFINCQFNYLSGSCVGQKIPESLISTVSMSLSRFPTSESWVHLLSETSRHLGINLKRKCRKFAS